MNRHRYILSKPQWIIVVVVAFLASLTVPSGIFLRKAVGNWVHVIEFSGNLFVNVALMALLMFLFVGFVVGLYLHKGNRERER